VSPSLPQSGNGDNARRERVLRGIERLKQKAAAL